MRLVISPQLGFNLDFDNGENKYVAILFVQKKLMENFEKFGNECVLIDDIKNVSGLKNSVILNFDLRKANYLYYKYFTYGAFTYVPRIINFYIGSTEYYKFYSNRIFLEAVNYPAIFFYKRYYDTFVSHIRKVVSAGVYKEFEKKLYYVNLGSFLEYFKFGGKGNRENVILYPANRMGIEKRLDLLLEICDLLYMSGYKFTLQFNLVFKNKYLNEVKSRSYCRVFDNDRERYTLESTNLYKCFIATADFGSYGHTYRELLYSGVLGVFRDREWVRYLFDGFDYKYIYKDKYTAVEMVKDILNNYDEEYAKKVSDFIYSRYYNPNKYKQVLDIITDLNNRNDVWR